MQARNTDLERRAKCGHRFMVQYVDATLEGDLAIEAFWDNIKKLAQDPTTSIKIDVQFLPALEHSSTPPSDNQSRILRLRTLIALCLLSLLFGVSIVIEQLEYSTTITHPPSRLDCVIINMLYTHPNRSSRPPVIMQDAI